MLRKKIYDRLYHILFIRKIDDGEYSCLNNQVLVLGEIRMARGSRIGFGNFKTSEWIASRKNFLKNNGKISLGEEATIAAGYRILCNGEISIGNYTYINPN